MGEYEPDDSRAVTLSNATAPGEPERTGPREDEARRAATAEPKMADAAPAGDPRPVYDQYALNDPQANDRERGQGHAGDGDDAPAGR